MSVLKTEIRDGMKIDWNVNVSMDDGLVLKADVFRSIENEQYPVLLPYCPPCERVGFSGGLSECLGAHGGELS